MAGVPLVDVTRHEQFDERREWHSASPGVGAPERFVGGGDVDLIVGCHTQKYIKAVRILYDGGMSALHPTPTRLALLSAARDGRVRRESHQYWLTPQEVRVTARVLEQFAAGWLQHGAEVRPGKVAVVPTQAGLTVLAAQTPTDGRCGR
jgi:hypothetical protein